MPLTGKMLSQELEKYSFSFGCLWDILHFIAFEEKVTEIGESPRVSIFLFNEISNNDSSYAIRIMS